MSVTPNPDWQNNSDNQQAPGQFSGQAAKGGPSVPKTFPQFQPTSEPEQPRRQQGDGGCLLPVLGIGTVVLSLIVLALLLPPISLWDVIDDAVNGSEDDTAAGDELVFLDVSATTPRIESEGLTITANGNLAEPFGVHVAALSPADYLAENTPSQGWTCETALPVGFALASNVYSLMQNGTLPRDLMLEVPVLPEFGGDDNGSLALYSWNADRGEWSFLPAQPAETAGTLIARVTVLPRCVAAFREAASVRQVGVTLATSDTFAADMLAANSALYPGALHPTADGALSGVLAPGFETGQAYDVFPVVQNFGDPAVIDVATVRRILQSASLRKTHARQIAAFVLREDAGYAGVLVDYRALPSDLRDQFSVFVRELSGLLQPADRRLVVAVPMPEQESSGSWLTGAYDWRALGRYADAVVINGPLDPLAYAPGGAVDAVLDWAAGDVSRGKLVLSLSALSVEDAGQGIAALMAADEAVSFLTDVQFDAAEPLEPGQTVTVTIGAPGGITAAFERDDAANTPALRYVGPDDQLLRTMWITDPLALRYRLERATAHGLGGVLVRETMAAGVLPGVDTALLAYWLDQPVEGGTYDPVLEWIVKDEAVVLVQEIGQLGQPFVVQLADGQKTLTVDAVIDGVLVGSRTAAVAVPEEPETTPAPEESAPAESESALADEAAPAEAESTPEPATAADIAALPLPTLDPAILAQSTIGDEFEVGAQVNQINATSIRAVGRTHLAWVKVDVAYTPDSDPADQQSLLDDIQANGFKALLTVTGSLDDLANADRVAYFTEYAAYVGGLAAMGADGIEIWQDMNSATAWPSGELDPAAGYVRLLALSFNAIKVANPNTMVITGGIGPTNGAGDTGQSDALWNDDVYLTALAAAGAADYADCIGVRYINGATAPDAVSGDSRGETPIYYLGPVIDRAANAFGGAKPVCLTALGYLSPEGVAPLPAGFEWAQNTTLDLHAQWLTGAVEQSRDGGRVRLLVIWNVDFATVDDTTVAGAYAIVRPDGACPACDRLTLLFE
ncbi:MAG: hypothetical protein JW966_01450 [Anaerolineae bacterium]|nr:hypothetical protein [Anaerolineae bacterium]